MFFLFDVKVVQQRKTFAQMTYVRMEECVSASGTPTAATVQQDTEARTVNKVRKEKKGIISQDKKCVNS